MSDLNQEIATWFNAMSFLWCVEYADHGTVKVYQRDQEHASVGFRFLNGSRAQK